MQIGIAERQKHQLEVGKLQDQINKLHEKIAGIRAKQPRKAVQDYALTAPNGKKVKLSQMFGKHDKLVVIHNMGFSCPMCTLWADGFNAQRYFADQYGGVSMVVVSPDKPKAQAAGIKKRGWTIPLYSSEGSTFTDDMGFLGKPPAKWTGPLPGVSTFVKGKGGAVELYAQDGFGPGDPYCGVFHLYRLLPEKKK
ncbi:MAG: DUF899 family protein [Planctomycetes bacterium]|nr:DUF899 family protein [Planctomycetota bacterium]